MKMAAQTVLVVDDNEDTREAIERVLVGAGYRCVTACSGASAFRTFLTDTIDLVLTDLNMAGGDGFRLIERLIEVSSIPIVVMTGLDPRFSRKSRDNPLSRLPFLLKPFHCSKLEQTVAENIAVSTASRVDMTDLIM